MWRTGYGESCSRPRMLGRKKQREKGKASKTAQVQPHRPFRGVWSGEAEAIDARRGLMRPLWRHAGAA